MSLPNTYHSLVQTTLSTSFEKILLARVYMLLQAETSRLESTISSADSAMATTAKPDTRSTDSKRPPRPVRVCQLGHRGHSDDYCRVQIQQKLEEAEKKVKTLTDNANKKDSANLVSSNPTTDQSPSYWDDAFIVGRSSLDYITLDSAATSTMFGNHGLLKNLVPTQPSEIGVALKNGAIYSTHRGDFKMGGLCLKSVIYSPDLSVNLISAGKIYDMGLDIKWGKLEASICDSSGANLLTFV